MKKLILLLSIFSIAGAGLVKAQSWKQDSVILDNKYRLQVYYNLSNGNRDTVDIHNWDLAFRPGTMTDGIFVNSAAGTRVFRVSTDTTQWASAWDTSGLGGTSKPELFNTDTSWEVGAFNREATGFPDFSWGKYDPVAKVVTGNRLYLVVGNAPPQMTPPMMKVWIVEKNYGVWKVRIAQLDNTGDTTIMIKSTDFANSNFAYLWFNQLQVLNREPNKTNWDILFTRYYGLQQGGSYYPVVGALTNIGVVTAKADGADPDLIKWADYSAQTSTAINTIGSDWKAFDLGTNQYTMTPDRSYFIKTKAGVIYKLKFTGFAGSSTGQINFSIEDLANGIVTPSSNINGIALYPNPVNESSKVVAHFNASVQNLQIEILDLNGKVCGTIYQNVQAGLQTLNIPSTQLASGFYFLRMSSGADQALVKFLIP